MAVRSWSTGELAAEEQFAFWREVVWEAFVPVTLAREDPGAFRGRVSAEALGPIGVSTIVSQPQTVERTAADVGRAAGDVFFLNLPTRGGSTVSQGDRVAPLAPGDFAIVDGAAPFRLDFGADFEQVSLTLPHDLLAPLLPVPEQATAVAVDGRVGAGAVAAAALRSLAGAGTPPDAVGSRALAAHLAALVALALGAGTTAAPGSRPVLVQAALDEVERSLADPALSPALVASRIDVSTRLLHRLFSERGPSFGRWLLARRLSRCHADLADPALADRTIGEIAWRNGFADPSYFARAFRRHYGQTPRQHRRAAAASGARP